MPKDVTAAALAQLDYAVAHQQLRAALKNLLRGTDSVSDNLTDAEVAEDDPAVLNRLGTANNSLGAFRRLTQDAEDASAKVLRHFRQVRTDTENLRMNVT
jgi:hypothetical protein